MDKEVDPQVLAAVNEKRLSGPPLSPVEIVAKMGVFDARERAYDTAWLATGDNVIATIWAEYVNVSADGHWFYVESLDAQHRVGGGTRSPNQVQRSKDRVTLLKQTLDAGKGFRAVLQTNRVLIAEAETNKSAKVSTRVQDDKEWHVAVWEPEQLLAILVRGPRGWMPTEEEQQAAKLLSGIPDLSPPDPAEAQAGSGEGIQSAALDYVTKHFKGYGYKAENVSAQNVGFHLEVSNAKGAVLLRVCVQGISAAAPNFRLTKDELSSAAGEPLWRLLVVTDPTGPAAQHKIYKPSEMDQAPGLMKQPN